jgi:signal transduction histidine kinase
MHRRAARTALAACGAITLFGVALAGARAAKHRTVRLFDRAEQGSLPLRGVFRALRSGSLPTRTAAVARGDALSRRKQDFLGLLSHELRNPLEAIGVALAIMRSREGIEQGQRARRVIERQVQHIGRLVDDLVDTARIERGTLSLQVEPIDLGEVLTTAVEMVQPSVGVRNQTFDWEPSSGLIVSGDRVRLQQVFSNLLLNASKYTPQGGRITLATYRAGSDVCVRIRDTGQGIAAEDLHRVFEPFVRASREEPGLGVGLYLARTLVEQHGGVIAVESRGPDTGSTFTVRLPELSPLLRQVSSSG